MSSNQLRHIMGAKDMITTSWFQSNPKKTLIYIYLVFCLLFVAGDFIVSNVHKSSTDIDLYKTEYPIGHVHKNNFTCFYGLRFWNPFKNRIHFNNLGFRADVPCNDAAVADREVIFTVGDSTTAALEVPLEKSYPAVLARELGSGYAVFNAGVRAYDTQQVIIQYVAKLRKLRPAKIIYMICANDLPHNVRTDSKSEYVQYFGKGIIGANNEVSYIKPARDAISPVKYWTRKFKVNLNLTSYVCKLVAAAQARLQKKQPNRNGRESRRSCDYYTDENIQRMQELLTYFDAVTQKDGVALYVAFYPGFAQELSTAESSQQYKVYSALKRFVTQRLGNTVFIPTVDIFLKQYKKNPDKPRFTFGSDHHANEYGNRQLARVIAGYVQR